MHGDPAGPARRDVLRWGLLAGAAPLLISGHAVAAPARQRTEVLGHSVQGRPLSALVLGADGSSRTALVVGCIHGSETAGIDIVRRLERLAPAADTQLWLVRSVNPDGALRHTRQNARGVDLNRNFPTGWHPDGVRGGTYYPGTGPLSEPESQAVATLLRRVRPDLTFWYHQHLDLVDLSGGDPGVSRRYARRTSLPAVQLQRYGGSVATWQNTVFPAATSVVVELPARVTAAMVATHAGAVQAACQDLAA